MTTVQKDEWIGRRILWTEKQSIYGVVPAEQIWDPIENPTAPITGQIYESTIADITSSGLVFLKSGWQGGWYQWNKVRVLEILPEKERDWNNPYES